jgi:hypothetical protein
MQPIPIPPRSQRKHLVHAAKTSGGDNAAKPVPTNSFIGSIAPNMWGARAGKVAPLYVPYAVPH